MGWLEDAWDEVSDTTEDAWDAVSDTAEDAWDAVSDTAEDAWDAVTGEVEDVVDAVSDTVEDVWDWISDTAEDVWDWISDTAEDVWDWISDTAEDVWDWISDTAEDVWDWITETAENIWDWVSTTAEDVWEWISKAAEKIYDFIVEEALPFIFSLAKLLILIVKFFGSLLILPLCYLIKKIFGEEEETIIQGIAAHEPRLLEEFKVARIPMNRKFVIFSDVHMYVEGDLDFYNKYNNSDIYLSALNWYSNQDYHLIENGDIEDFWMRGGSSKGNICDISQSLPWPFYSDFFESEASLSANLLHALNIFTQNAKTYTIIKNLFHDNGRYTRIIGNHDDVWADPRMDEIIRYFYPGIEVNDYCTLEDPNLSETLVIITHGHQSDTFNMPLCNFAGKVATEAASILHEISFGSIDLFSRGKEEWEKEWNDKGFKNELEEINLPGTTLSEYDLYKGLKKIYGSSYKQPHLILGHTHKPKKDAGIPNYMFHDEWNWEKYANSGSTGMWEEIVFNVEIDYPNVRMVAWKKEDNGNILRYELKSYTYGDTYLKP